MLAEAAVERQLLKLGEGRNHQALVLTARVAAVDLLIRAATGSRVNNEI